MQRGFLLIDDDPDDAEIFQEALAAVDSSIIFYLVQDGQYALEKLEEINREKPHIIFLDINMRGVNGWECLTLLKSNATYHTIPVIMYSTASSQKEIDIALNLGAICFYTKPTEFNELKKVLKIIADNLDGDLMNALAGISGIKFPSLL